MSLVTVVVGKSLPGHDLDEAQSFRSGETREVAPGPSSAAGLAPQPAGCLAGWARSLCPLPGGEVLKNRGAGLSDSLPHLLESLWRLGLSAQAPRGQHTLPEVRASLRASGRRGQWAGLRLGSGERRLKGSRAGLVWAPDVGGCPVALGSWVASNSSTVSATGWAQAGGTSSCRGWDVQCEARRTALWEGGAGKRRGRKNSGRFGDCLHWKEPVQWPTRASPCQPPLLWESLPREGDVCQADE